MIIIGGLGSIMGTLMGTAFMVLVPEAMGWITDAVRGSPSTGPCRSRTTCPSCARWRSVW